AAVTVIPMRGPWQTETARVLASKLASRLGDRTAKPFAALGITTVGDLLRHVPRRWMSGTESSSLADLQVGEDVAVLARVVDARVTGAEPRRRLAATITDGSTRVPLTFFARSKSYGRNTGMLEYWQKQLPSGARGIFAGKVSEFRGEPQLTNPDFVVIDDEGTIIGGAQRNQTMGRLSRAGGLLGIYPQTSKLPTWTIAECIGLVLDQLDLVDPWPDWVLAEAGLVDL